MYLEEEDESALAFYDPVRHTIYIIFTYHESECNDFSGFIKQCFLNILLLVAINIKFLLEKY